MALVECPECGKENVSDSAEACPNCGYGIKVYFEKIKQEEEKKRKQEEKQREKERITEKLAKEEKSMLDEIPAPAKPFPWQPLIGIFLVTLAIFFFTVSEFFVGLVVSIFALIFGLGGYWNYQDKRRIYEMSLQNMEQAKKELLWLKMIDQTNPIEKSRIKCPMCGKNTGKKISTTSRVVSVTAVGLASGKIGKQYKCSSCGHMW